MTKAQIKARQRAGAAAWLEGCGGVRPPRQRKVLTDVPRRGFRGVIYPNRARRWAGTEPLRLRTLY